MANVLDDKLPVLEASERHGSLRRMVRLFQVEGIIANDWSALMDALTHAGMPEYMSTLTESGSPPGAFDLVLTERNPKVVDTGGGTVRVDVELVYESYADIPENLTAPRDGLVGGEVRTSLQQKQTNEDENGEQIKLYYTYPGDTEPTEAGGQYTYFEPQRSIYIQGHKQTATPWDIANVITGCVNEVAWSGGDPRHWLCTGCSWRFAGNDANLNNWYFMNFEFQYDPDSWDPTVWFIDKETGQPPPDLVEGGEFPGKLTIPKLPACDFEAVMGVVLQGG